MWQEFRIREQCYQNLLELAGFLFSKLAVILALEKVDIGWALQVKAEVGKCNDSICVFIAAEWNRIEDFKIGVVLRCLMTHATLIFFPDVF